MDADQQEKLNKLERLEEGSRERARRYQSKARGKGLVQISAFLKPDAHNALCKLRDDSIKADYPKTFGDILSEALLEYVSHELHLPDKIISIDPDNDPRQLSLFNDNDQDPAATAAVKPEPAPITKSNIVGVMTDHERTLLAIDADGGSWKQKADKANAWACAP